MKEKYPQLAKYLHSAKVADRIYAAKRPGTWIKWGFFAVMIVFFAQDNNALALASFALLMVVDFLFTWFRLKPDGLADFVRRGVEEKMPTHVKRHFDKGDLDVIGSEAMSALERCATSVNEVVQLYVYHDLLGATLSKELKKALQKELNGTDVVMRAALKTLYSIDGLAEAADRDYDPVRKAAQVLSLNLEEELKPK